MWVRIPFWVSYTFKLFSCLSIDSLFSNVSFDCLSLSHANTGWDDANLRPYPLFTKWVGSEFITQQWKYCFTSDAVLHHASNDTIVKARIVKMCLCRPLQVLLSFLQHWSKQNYCSDLNLSIHALTCIHIPGMTSFGGRHITGML